MAGGLAIIHLFSYLTMAVPLPLVEIGSSADATAINATALGGNTFATGLRSTALGVLSQATGENSVALGANSTDGGFANVVSVDRVGSEQTVINVAAGNLAAGETNAVNGGQLFTTNQTVVVAPRLGSQANSNTCQLTVGSLSPPAPSPCLTSALA